MANIPGGAGVIQTVIALILARESGRTAKRGSRVRQSMTIRVSDQVLQTARIALFPLGSEAGIVTEAKGGGQLLSPSIYPDFDQP